MYDPYIIIAVIVNSFALIYQIYSKRDQTDAETVKTIAEAKIAEAQATKIDAEAKVTLANALMQSMAKSVEQNANFIDTLNKREARIDDLVSSLYGLLEFEKEIIREFYQINVDRKKDTVKNEDIRNYVDRFRQNFNFFLDKNYRLNAYLLQKLFQIILL